MLLALAAIVVGVAILAWAADQFVLGAARIALIKNVPALVVGVVIVGFGTSAPEMLVSAIATVSDEPAVAIGNVVGSNIANLSLLLGIGALMVPIVVDSRTVKREGLLVIAATVLFGLAVQGGGISRMEGIGLLIAMGGALYMITRKSTDDPLQVDTEEFADSTNHGIGKESLRTIIGLLATVGSAQLLLWGALEVARRTNLSGGFVGVTLVAVGTSLPELVTVIQSARRKETDLIVGNLLGSNLFNALAVGGVIGVIGGPSVDEPSLTVVASIAAVVIAVAATLIMRTAHAVHRREGIVMVLAYCALVPFLA